MLQNNVEMYLESLRIVNLAANTIKTYTQALEGLIKFVGPEADTQQIDVNVMRAYVHVLAAKGLSGSTRNHAFRVFKAFGKFLEDEGIVAENVFQFAPSVKAPTRLIDPPSVEDVATLLDGEMPTAWPARDRAELELLYGTGVRVQEAAGIMLSDLRSDGIILIHGKGDKERFVPIGGCLKSALDAYLPEREKMLRECGLVSQALFFSISQRTKNRPYEPVNVRSISRTLKEACKAKSLKPMHPHLLRHA
jgi:integrase/recombinase XerC